MAFQKTTTISLDFEEVYLASRSPRDPLEIVLYVVEEGLEERIRVARELAYPFPIAARVIPHSKEDLHPLLHTLAMAGVQNIIFNHSSILHEAKALNIAERWGLSFHLRAAFE